MLTLKTAPIGALPLAESWLLTSQEQRLVRTGERLAKSALYYWLLLMESHLTKKVVWRCAPAEWRALASSGIAAAVEAGHSIRSQRVTEGG
jgi:hypothetical protein